MHRPAWGGVVINEFLADPAGADSGQEFVELLNTGPGAFNLAGLEFQFANGSVGPEWVTRWTAGEDTWLAEGQRFLLVDRNWLGDQPFDAEVWLGLQNGPDAIRLHLGTEVLDMVGYGPLTDPEMLEGAAVSLPVGLSLMRKPDGHDTDHNNLDFFPGQPTAGAVNYQDHEINVVLVETVPPSLAEVGGSVLLTVELHNSGLADIPPNNATLSLKAASGEIQPVLSTFFAGCPAGDNCRLMMVFSPVIKGRFTILLELLVPGSGGLAPVPLGKYQVGCGPVFLSEVLAAPALHQGEWIEIQAGSEPVQLGEFQIRDEEGDWRPLPAIQLNAQQFILVAQDSTALSNWHSENLLQGLVLDCPANQLNRVMRQIQGSWPSLNNSSPRDRSYADRVYLADSQGVVDHVTIPGDSEVADFRGISWERMSHDPQSFRWSDWRASVAVQGGTPGCPNSTSMGEATAGVLEVVPALLDTRQGGGIVHVRFFLEPGELGWHVEIFDLWGGMIRDLGGGEMSSGPGDLIWDGKDDQGRLVKKGAYVVLLLKSREDGVFGPSAKYLVVVR